MREWLLAAALLVAANTHASEPRGIRLLGTIVSSNPQSSSAVVDEGGKQHVVQPGMPLAGGEVIEIQPDAVLVRTGGRIEKLRLASLSVPSQGGNGSLPASPDGGADPGDAPSAPQARPSQPRVTPRSAVMSGNARRNRPLLDRASAGSRSEGETARSNDQLLADLAGQARFAPVMDNDGKLRGVAVMNIVPDSMIERLGLRSDDVVTAINGTPVDSSGRAMNVARGLGRGAPINLDIERKGIPTKVTIDPRSL